jgi:hypothetical protein
VNRVYGLGMALAPEAVFRAPFFNGFFAYAFTR